MGDAVGNAIRWPDLPWAEWEATANTLQLWTQIVGKTRLALTPLKNHWWNVPLYVTARGLGTSAMAYGDEVLDIEFDFVAHELRLRLGSGAGTRMALRPQTVAEFFREYRACLAALGVEATIMPMPVEVADPVRFDLDREHRSYDPEYAHRFWRVLVQTERVFHRFGTDFVGKVSPVHFFWGSFDLAVTRFSGRPAPPRPKAGLVEREAYSHEVISAGFWPGNGGYGEAAFYCYASPVPEGLAGAAVRPAEAAWQPQLGEFIFPYRAMRSMASPDEALMEFLRSSYGAAADMAGWDRALLDRQ